MAGFYQRDARRRVPGRVCENDPESLLGRLPLNSNDELQRDVAGPNFSLLLHHRSEFTLQRDGIDFRIAAGHRRLRLWFGYLRWCLLYGGRIRCLAATLCHRGGSYSFRAALRRGGIRPLRTALCRRSRRSRIRRALGTTNRECSEIVPGFQLVPPLGLIEKQISGLLRPETAGYPQIANVVRVLR